MRKQSLQYKIKDLTNSSPICPIWQQHYIPTTFAASITHQNYYLEIHRWMFGEVFSCEFLLGSEATEAVVLRLLLSVMSLEVDLLTKDPQGGRVFVFFAMEVAEAVVVSLCLWTTCLELSRLVVGLEGGRVLDLGSAVELGLCPSFGEQGWVRVVCKNIISISWC